MADTRASAGWSVPEHTAVIGMKESEMADVVTDVDTPGDIPVLTGSLLPAVGPPGAAPGAPGHQPPSPDS